MSRTILTPCWGYISPSASNVSGPIYVDRMINDSTTDESLTRNLQAQCPNPWWSLFSPHQISQLFQVFLTQTVISTKPSDIYTTYTDRPRCTICKFILCMSSLLNSSWVMFIVWLNSTPQANHISLTFPWPMPNSLTFPGFLGATLLTIISPNKTAELQYRS